MIIKIKENKTVCNVKKRILFFAKFIITHRDEIIINDKNRNDILLILTPNIKNAKIIKVINPISPK